MSIFGPFSWLSSISFRGDVGFPLSYKLVPSEGRDTLTPRKSPVLPEVKSKSQRVRYKVQLGVHRAPRSNLSCLYLVRVVLPFKATCREKIFYVSPTENGSSSLSHVLTCSGPLFSHKEKNFRGFVWSKSRHKVQTKGPVLRGNPRVVVDRGTKS